MPARRYIDLPDLLSATGYEKRDLWDLRRRGLFPFKPEHTHVPGRRGSASKYPLEALDYLQRLKEVQQQSPRKSDEWLWRMWLDPADWPIDMRAWVLRKLDDMLDTTRRAKARGLVLEPGDERQFLRAGHVRNVKNRQAGADWLIAWTMANERPDLYSAMPEGVRDWGFDDLLLRLIGAPLLAGFRDIKSKGRREQISKRGGPYLLAHFRRITALARDRHIEQVRRDYRAIFRVIESAERVDWNKVSDFTEGAKPEPPSWAARKARRTRPKPPPHFIKSFIETWRRGFDDRAALLFSTLLTARRLLSRAPIPRAFDFMIGMVQQWLDGLPQLQPASPPLDVQPREKSNAPRRH